MTDAELRKMFPDASEDFYRANAGKVGLVTPPGDGAGSFTKPQDRGVSAQEINAMFVEPNFIPRQSNDEQKLNKTEKAYLAHLRRLNLPQIRIQAITLKLADDCRLTPDFSYRDENGRMVLVDVKGFWREDAQIKIKVAARLFTEFRFIVAWKNKSSWDEKEIKP